LLSLICHRELRIIIAAAAAAGVVIDARDITDVGVEANFEMRLFGEIVEVGDNLFSRRKQLSRVSAEPLCGLLVADFGD